MSARTDSTASLLVGRLVSFGSYSLSNTETVWETVSTFVLQFSQDGLLELLAFLIEAKDTATPQLAEPPAHKKKNVEQIILRTDFVYFFTWHVCLHWLVNFKY